MNLLFIEGEKGLVAQDAGKFYFPDRKSSIKVPGMYDCTVSIDKGKYAFVVGEKVETPLITEESYVNLVKRSLERDDSDYIHFDSISCIAVGNDVLIKRKNPFRIYLDVLQADGSCKSGISYISDYRTSSIYSALQEKQVDIQCLLKFIDGVSIIPTEKRLEVLSMAVSSYISDLKYLIDNWAEFSIRILEDRFIDISYKKYGDVRHDVSILINGKLKELPDSFSKSILNREVTFSTSWNELSKMLYGKHFGFPRHGEKNDTLVINTITCFGQTITLKLLNALNCKNWNERFINESERRHVCSSFDEFESFKKAVAKNVTSKTIDELKLLAPQHVILS